MRVAVVGAGIAGLSAAQALVTEGHEVVVFEESPGPGGRVATRLVRNVELPRHGSVDLAFDHGAQYFTVRDSRFAGVVSAWERDRIVSRWTGRIVAFEYEGWEDVEEGTNRYVGVHGMSAIAKRLAAGLDVRYGERVESVAALGVFDRTIVAVPAPRAVALLAGSQGLAEKAASVTMKPCWSVMAAFEARVATRFDAAFVSGSPLGWIARRQSPGLDGVECWVLQATNDWSAAHLDDRPDTVGPFLLQAFADLVRAGLPRVLHLAAHRWRYATADPCLAVGALHDRARGISVCGDWCAGPRIEDAYLSGLAAATGR